MNEDGKTMLDRWSNALERVENLETRLAITKIQVEKLEAAVAHWIAPDGIRPGETVSRWCGDTLVMVTLFFEYPPGKSKYKIELRKKDNRLNN